MTQLYFFTKYGSYLATDPYTDAVVLYGLG